MKERKLSEAPFLPIIAIAVVAILLLGMTSASQSTSKPNPSFTQTTTAIINTTSNGYIVSNITILSPFTLTFNSTVLTVRASAPTPNTTGIYINNYTVYGLFLNTPALIKQSKTTNIYAELLKVNYYSKPQSTTIFFYSVARPKPPLLNSTYQIPGGTPLKTKINGINTTVIFKSAISASVRLLISNITNSTIPPKNYTTLLALNTSLTAYQAVTTMLSVGYKCALQAGAVVPFGLASNGTWVGIKPFTTNSSTCTVLFTIPSKSTIGLFVNNKYITSSTTVATTASTSITTPIQTTIPLPQTKTASTSYESSLAITIIVIIVIVAIIYLEAKKKKHKKARRKHRKRHNFMPDEESG